MSIVPQFKIITDCGKGAFSTWVVSSDKYDVTGFRWEEGQATASSTSTSVATLSIPSSDGTKVIECTLRNDDNRVIQLKLKENRSLDRYQLLAEEIAGMSVGEQLADDLEDALVDELLDLIGPVPSELVNESYRSKSNSINESRWLQLAGLSLIHI